MEIIYIGLLLLALGVSGGFLAGLLGVGGGIIFVPGLYYILRYFDYHENAMHIAVGTSLLTIVFTGASSAYAHYKKGAVDIELFKGFLPGIFFGVIIGTILADTVSTAGLKIVFATSQIIFGSYMLLRTHKTNLFESMPKQPWLTVISTLSCCLSTMMGVGGGIKNVTFMTICNVPIHKAIATAAAIGPIMAIFAAGGFLYIGLGDQNLPPYSVGYINLAAFGTIILTSTGFARVGARFAHSLPVPKLKRYFSIFMLIISVKMISEIFIG
jgi:uncharacterized membrane protein YfcA